MAKPQFKKAVDTNIKTDLPTLRQPEKFMERTEQISWTELEKKLKQKQKRLNEKFFQLISNRL